MAGLTRSDSDLLVWDSSKTALQVKLGELVQYFQVGIPQNDNGLPTMYIDPTQLMPVLLQIDSPDDVPDEKVEDAKTSIEYTDGFPTVEGIPFWERLEGEPVPYYNLFKEYREMKYVGESNKVGIFTRSIAKLSRSANMPGRQLNALSRIYHWQARVKAYDMFKQIQIQAEKSNQREQLECKHATVSNQLLDEAVEYLTKHPEQLSAKTAIDLVQLAMKSGRLALGMNPDKPGLTASEGRSSGTNVNIINQNANVGEGGQVSQGTIALSDVEKKTQENSEDVTNLQSILHVLNANGAFDAAAGQEKKEQVDLDENGDPIEADYTVE